MEPRHSWLPAVSVRHTTIDLMAPFYSEQPSPQQPLDHLFGSLLDHQATPRRLFFEQKCEAS